MCDTHLVPELPARLQVPAPQAVAEPRLPAQRWPDAQLAALLLGRLVQMSEGQPIPTEPTGLVGEKKKKFKQAITFQRNPTQPGGKKGEVIKSLLSPCFSVHIIHTYAVLDRGNLAAGNLSELGQQVQHFQRGH